MPVRFLSLFFLLSSLAAPAQKRDPLPFTKGVYGDAGAFLRHGMSFKSLGINALFVRSVSIDDGLLRAAREQGVRVYAEFPTLNGKEYLDAHPEAWPINAEGQRAPIADWFMGVCLTDPAFREYREEQLRTLLRRYSPDGVWLDYLHWHAQFETPEPILPETCFCHRCIRQFENAMEVVVPPGRIQERSAWILSQSDSLWRQWRTSVLTDWVSGMKVITKEINPSALLGLYYCPWYPGDYGGAHYRILGLDMKTLARTADVLSPMLYHQMMGRPVDWVRDYVMWLKDAGISDGEEPLIWPIVQAHNKPGTISRAEFQQVMENGSAPPSSGIMMFTLHTLISEPEKLQVMRDLYRKK